MSDWEILKWQVNPERRREIWRDPNGHGWVLYWGLSYDGAWGWPVKRDRIGTPEGLPRYVLVRDEWARLENDPRHPAPETEEEKNG